MRSDALFFARFTPTHVGTSVPGIGLGAGGSVHPHACGDIRKPNMANFRARGSPPRMWGHRQVDGRGGAAARFTPTHVGTSASHCAYRSLLSVHPHACGDIVAWMPVLFVVPGSPPRMWGHPAFLRGWENGRRFTPTHVGTSLGLPRKTLQYGVMLF